MIDIVDIRTAIVSGQFTNSELDTIQTAITFARGQLTQQKIRTFNRGVMVKFTSNRNGQFYIGTVEKVNIKRVLVRTHTGLISVPANMLESV
jgi:small-conductance mechanosensitive channel